MTIIRAREWRNGKPIGPTQIIEPKPKTIAEKAADVVEKKLDQFANWNAGCGGCRGARKTVASKAKETLRKVVPKR